MAGRFCLAYGYQRMGICYRRNIGHSNGNYNSELPGHKSSQVKPGQFAQKRINMFTNYLKIALRNIRRNISYTVLNVAGLTLSIASCLVIFLIVKNELTYDQY